TLNVCVRLAAASNEDATPRFAVIPFGRSRQRFITLPSETGYAYILLEDVVGLLVERFFPGESVAECVPFRITRNAELELREDQASDLMAEMEEAIGARRHTSCVRLEVAAQASDELLSFLRLILELRDEDVYRTPGPIDLAAWM